MLKVTCKSPVNIATIKYWGKRDEELILPLNDSFSVTLSCDELSTTTTAALSSSFVKDRMWLDEVEVDISKNRRLTNCINSFKRHNLKRKAGDEDKKTSHVHVVSSNNFPTAAGLASSASGYSCLVYALAQLFHVKEDLSVMARHGSGSACRSMYGGFVHWEAGVKKDGSDSIAKQFKPAAHWPDMRILILIVNQNQKKVSSTQGMKRSVETSEFLSYRAKKLVPNVIRQMKEAVSDNNFTEFAEITMKDSNQFHSVCLDSYPPIAYLNDSSHQIIQLITQYNTYYKTNRAAYSFDAGPNATIFTLDKYVPEIISLIRKFFPPTNTETIATIPVTDVSKGLQDAIDVQKVSDMIQKVICTKVGDGLQVVSDDHSLMDKNGYPKTDK